MAQGLRKVLSLPSIFDLFQVAVARKNAFEDFIRDYVRPREGMAILDIGCGTGKILEYLPEHIVYKGYDISSAYIDAARKNYGRRGSFIVGDAAQALDEPAQSYDLAMVVGVLHHLDDSTASDMLAKISRILKPGGRFVSVDGVYTDDQSWLARRILSADRGEHVREKDHYLRLVKQQFSLVDHSIHHNRLRIPYTHIIIVAHKQ